MLIQIISRTEPLLPIIDLLLIRNGLIKKIYKFVLIKLIKIKRSVLWN